MLVHTASGTQSVGHLRATPLGFSKLFRPDVTFACGGLLFPAHSIVLAVSSRFFCDFFRFLHGSSGRPAPDQPISLSSGAVQCAALGARSFDSYLCFAYSGALPPGLDAAPAAIELLRLSAFFGNAALTAQLGEHLCARVAAGSLAEGELAELLRAAVDLKHRRLAAECLPLLLPSLGRGAVDPSLAAAAAELLDPPLSKTVLAQLAHQEGAAAAFTAAAGPSAAAGAAAVRTASGPIALPPAAPSEAGSVASEADVAMCFSPPFSPRVGPAVPSSPPRGPRLADPAAGPISMDASMAGTAGRASVDAASAADAMDAGGAADALEARLARVLSADAWHA